jgi:hypothetical protein
LNNNSDDALHADHVWPITERHLKEVTTIDAWVEELRLLATVVCVTARENYRLIHVEKTTPGPEKYALAGSHVYDRRSSVGRAGRVGARADDTASPSGASHQHPPPADERRVPGAARYRGWRRPALAGIIGARRAWTESMISALSIPCRYTDVIPRLACPSWRWMTFSGTPSRAISTACA